MHRSRPAAAIAAAAAAAALLGLGVGTIPIADAATPPVVRIFGIDRYETAAHVSASTFAPGVPVAYIAVGTDFPDALAAGPAGALVGGPVLLTERDSVPDATAGELARLHPARIVVLGGTGAITDGVVAQLESQTGVPVDRVAGADRFATAAAIAANYPPNRPLVYVASGLGFADALAAASAAGQHGAPLLLVRPDGVPSATADQLTRLSPDLIVLAGGTNAVSAAVETQLGQLVPDADVVRLAGADRYATSVAIAANSLQADSTAPVFLATGENFPDALAGSVPAGRTPGPLLLTRHDCVPASVINEIDRRDPVQLVVLGGESAVSTSAAALTECPPPPPPPGHLQPGTTIAIGPMQTHGFGGHLGADWLDAAGNQICAPAGCGHYWGLRTFTTSGLVEGGGVPVEPAGVAMGRLEFYPDLEFGHLDTYDPWNPALTVGGLHLWNPDGRAVNGLTLPHASNGAVRYVAPITNGGAPVADGRVQVLAFQYIPKDATPGAFGYAFNRGGQWTVGWIWPAPYELFVVDTATNTSHHATVTLDPASPLTIDLSHPCFGLPTC